MFRANSAYGLEQRRVLERLEKISFGASGRAELSHVALGVRRDHDGRNLDSDLIQMKLQLQPIHAGHLQVEDQAIGPSLGTFVR